MDQPHASHPGQPDPAAPPASLSAEHDWAAAAPLVIPVLRPAGTAGIRAADVGTPAAAAGDTRPLVDDGPCGIAVVYALPAAGYDVFASGDHLASWGVSVVELRAAAAANLARWSAAAPWMDEADGARRIRSSATGDGVDAARILLPEVRAELAAALGVAGGRVMVGLPERHLLIAGSLAAGDAEFAGQLADFVAMCADGADEPVDARLFELREDRLVELADVGAPAG